MLPGAVRDMLPFGTEDPDADGADGAPKDIRSKTSWQDVCFTFHSIPGEDDDEGLAVLADGSMRRYIQCKGINALLFDENDRESLARSFANFANSCDTDIQVIIKARNLPVDEYLSRLSDT